MDFKERFVLNAVACASATLVTHPIELVKTRMQLQGELTQSYERTYSKNFASARLIAKADGLGGLYAGLRAGLSYQMLMNGTRLTLFDKLKDLNMNLALAGMVAGAIAGALGSPLYLLKTQQQALSNLAVGNQHTEANTSIVSFFRNEYNTGGLRRIFRGTSAQVLRVTVGSGAQLSSFEHTKRYLQPFMADYHWFAITASSSLVASVFVVLFMSPFDVAATRVYNQPVDPVTSRGLLYSGPIDALYKIWKQEGSNAYLKGLRAGYPRHALQTILTMSIWDVLKRHYHKYKSSGE